ncbi:MAG: hypothetical protein K940chlam1_00206 [Candidatus Anoxychlamydiales bacterium]|nr:hypothetical protein [Candidatus Anoxychlamydiales bacterium]NGX35350.1 hypothetical protein [Candidatus Anoxychlamydiales bacterium]
MTTITAISDSQKLKRFEQKYSLEKQKIEYPKIISKFTSSSYGAKKVFRLGIINCSWLINFSNFFKLNYDTIKKIVDIKNDFHLVHKTLSITKIPNCLRNVNKSYNDYLKKEVDNTRKRDKLAQKLIKAFHEGTVIVQLGQLYCLYTFGAFSNKILTFSTKFFLFISSGFKLKMNTEDYLKHREIQKIAFDKKVDSRLKTILYEIKNLDLIKLIKSITSIVIGIFFLLEFIFAIVIVSPIIALILSTISVGFSVWSHLYKGSMSYQEIKNHNS